VPVRSSIVDAIDGVVVVDLAIVEDDRGGFLEFFRAGWLPAGMEVAQANLSISKVGVLRGMHYHRRQSDYWCLVAGRAFVALADLRGATGPPVPILTFELDAEVAPRGILIPPGVAHGFAALSDVRLVYLVDLPFDGTDEHGFAWNDPEVAIPWPLERPVVSDRDASAPPLARALVAAPVG
jgi:dTDP-4-dehydrorhamnose 3,5-epimerase